MMLQTDRPIVFLHIPKTAGQTIHSELSRVVGASNVSPVRVHTQVGSDQPQMPAGYRFYSGHIDWVELDALHNPFTFTVLRDPQERIASFYFYLLKEARALSETDLEKSENLGKKRVLERSTTDYFFGGDAAWQRFICDHYDNFYCRYFATRRMRGWDQFANLDSGEKRRYAMRNLMGLDRVYTTQDLQVLEDDLTKLLGQQLEIANSYLNAGTIPRHEPRWPRLVARLDRDEDIARLERFTTDDYILLSALNRHS